ncbi:MAG: hypothetical protein IPO31_16445 [Candidatus Obscuribacter sp.]|nr:hypothetical protein [Candidatus Obscuribacter sp.]
MLLDSRQSLSKIRGYKSPWLAMSIAYTVLCAFGACLYWGLQESAENELTSRLDLSPGPFMFESSRDSAYVLIKHYRPKLYYNSPRQHFELGTRASLPEALEAGPPGFDFGFTKTLDAIPPRVFWLKTPEICSIMGERRVVYAVFFAPKGRRLNINFKIDDSAPQEDFEVSLVMLGARFSPFGWYSSRVQSTGYLWADHVLSKGDLRFSCSKDLSDFCASPLDLPVPLTGNGEGLKLSQNVICGERLKSNMFCLPKNEEELKEFLAARHIEYSEGQPAR